MVLLFTIARSKFATYKNLHR